MFAIAALILSLGAVSLAPKVRTSPLEGRWSTTDQYNGKTLTPTNYTVIPGVFIQDSPKYNATNYNLLNDSFGLIDKSPERWQNFTR